MKMTFFDTECATDLDLHNDYRLIDPVQEKPRIGSRRVHAAAAFDIDLSEDGQISCTSLQSWTIHDHGDELAVVSGLFDHLRTRTDHIAIGYGSLAFDVPVLLLAAMEYGLSCPPQFNDGRPDNHSKLRHRHSDLGLILKGSGHTWHHLSEVILRLGLPVELIIDKARVIRPSDAAQWRTLRAHCELDTALTAIGTLAWLRSTGQANLSPVPMMVSILAGLRRHGRLTDEIAGRVARACAGLHIRIADQLKYAA